MSPLTTLAGLLLILVVLWDAFETMILARRVSRRLRLTRLFYMFTWRPWSWAVSRLTRPGNPRESYLSFYGPFSIVLLLAIWAAALIFGFALFQQGLGSPMTAPEGAPTFTTYLYSSGETFFTLGYGDVTPRSMVGRLLAVVEAGTGFGFLAIVIAYLPVLSQAFSRRELNISMLDERAGSPPTAAELLRRHGDDPHRKELGALLHDWERWSAELLESHISFPVLAFFRSQHDNQSWVSALTAILDTCALVIVGIQGAPVWPARLTFAMARHAVVDMASVFNRGPVPPLPDRLPPAELARLREGLAAAGMSLSEGEAADRKLAELRALYEPQINSLGLYLRMPLPTWLPPAEAKDNWQATV